MVGKGDLAPSGAISSQSTDRFSYLGTIRLAVLPCRVLLMLQQHSMALARTRVLGFSNQTGF